MNMEKNNDIIYALNDRPPLLETIFAAMQHLLAIFVAIMTPPLIIASQLGFDLHTTSYMVSMALFASGVATFVQCRRFGPVGAGLLCIQGTSYSFIGPVIAAGMVGGPAVIFGTCMAASFVEVIIGRMLRYARKIITPVVSGIVVTLIGLCLIKVGVSACGGGNAAMTDGTFGSMRNLMLAGLVLLVIVFFNSCRNRMLRMSSVVIGLVVGYVVAWTMGMIDFSAAGSYSGFYLPQPFKYGIDFDWSAFISLSIIFVITAIEAYGDITANSLISGEPVEGKVFDKRVSGGVVAWSYVISCCGVQFVSQFHFRPEQRHDTAHRCGKPLRGLFHSAVSCAARTVPGRQSCVLAHARAGARRSHAADVRYGGNSRHTHHSIAEDRPQGGSCDGCQLLAWT